MLLFLILSCLIKTDLLFTYFSSIKNNSQISYSSITANFKIGRKISLRACLHGVGEPGLVGLVSFVFTLWGTQNKRNLPHQTGVPHSI